MLVTANTAICIALLIAALIIALLYLAKAAVAVRVRYIEYQYESFLKNLEIEAINRNDRMFIEFMTSVNRGMANLPYDYSKVDTLVKEIADAHYTSRR